jgi:hypothetical protein
MLLQHDRLQYNSRMGKKKVPLSEAGYSEAEILREAAKIMRSKQTKAPNPKKLSPCPKCGDMYGVAEMRTHKPKCKASGSGSS